MTLGLGLKLENLGVEVEVGVGPFGVGQVGVVVGAGVECWG